MHRLATDQRPTLPRLPLNKPCSPVYLRGKSALYYSNTALPLLPSALKIRLGRATNGFSKSSLCRAPRKTICLYIVETLLGTHLGRPHKRRLYSSDHWKSVGSGLRITSVYREGPLTYLVAVCSLAAVQQVLQHLIRTASAW